MEELFGTAPRPHLTPNYMPPVDVTPQTYQTAINNDLLFQGIRLNRYNDGFHGLIGFRELVHIAKDSFSKDPKKRRRALMRAMLAH